MNEGAVLYYRANGAGDGRAPQQSSSLAAAGVAMVLTPLTVFALTLWLTHGAPLHPPGATPEPELGALNLAARSN